MPSQSDMIRLQCWDNAIHDFGTAYVFECRARILRKRLFSLTFLGVIVPIFIGGIVTTYGTKFQYIGAILTMGGILGIIQLVASVWALVAKWDDQYAYAQESMASNYNLSDKYKNLAQNPPPKLDEFRGQLAFIDTENKRRSEGDYKQSISEREKRMGLRAALRKFQRACVGCKNVPASMTPTSCDICGNF